MAVSQSLLNGDDRLWYTGSTNGARFCQLASVHALGEDIMPQRPRRITLAAHTKAGRTLATQKRSHSDLTAAEHAARLASYTADLVWLLDDKGHFRYASPSCLHILGYDPATLIGTPVVDLVHPADLTTLCAARDQVVATGTAQ